MDSLWILKTTAFTSVAKRTTDIAEMYTLCNGTLHPIARKIDQSNNSPPPIPIATTLTLQRALSSGFALKIIYLSHLSVENSTPRLYYYSPRGVVCVCVCVLHGGHTETVILSSLPGKHIGDSEHFNGNRYIDRGLQGENIIFRLLGKTRTNTPHGG